MRRLYLFLAFYLTFLATFSCSENNASLGTKQTEVASQQDTRPKTSDLCSPLCLCRCSAGFTHLLEPTTQPIAEVKVFVKHSSSLYQKKLLKVYATIWQPPKITTT